MPLLQACLYGLLWQKRFYIQQSVRQSSGVLLSENTDSTGSPSSLGQTAVLKLAFGGGWAGRRRTGAPPHPSRRVRRQDARGSKTRRSVPVWQLLLPLLICIVFAAGRTGQKAARDTHTHIPLGGEKRPWLNQSLCGCYSWVLFNRCYPTRRSCWLSSSKERQSAWCHAATLTTESCKQSEENWLDDDLKKLKKKKFDINLK